MKRDKLKELAKSLYINGMQTQREIAERTGVSLPTINRWSQKGKWKELRVGKIVSKEESLKRIYNQINALTDEIDSREKRYPTASESDTLNKLAATINKLENDDNSPAMTYQVFTKFTSWLGSRSESKEDQEFLLQVLDSTKEYLNEILN